MDDPWSNPFVPNGRSVVPDPGGYNVFAVMDDGGVLCEACVVDPTNPVHDERVRNPPRGDGWGVIAFDHTGNVEDFLACDHCNKTIVEGFDE